MSLARQISNPDLSEYKIAASRTLLALKEKISNEIRDHSQSSLKWMRNIAEKKRAELEEVEGILLILTHNIPIPNVKKEQLIPILTVVVKVDNKDHGYPVTNALIELGLTKKIFEENGVKVDEVIESIFENHKMQTARYSQQPNRAR